MMMTQHQFAAALIAAALAFRQQQQEAADMARLRAAAGTDGEEPPEESDEEDLWEQFKSHVELRGLQVPSNTDILCFAGIREDEPSFTLRGQDILSSMLVRHWINLYESLAPDALVRKVNAAEAIADKMEMYDRQKWAD